MDSCNYPKDILKPISDEYNNYFNDDVKRKASNIKKRNKVTRLKNTICKRIDKY